MSRNVSLPQVNAKYNTFHIVIQKKRSKSIPERAPKQHNTESGIRSNYFRNLTLISITNKQFLFTFCEIRLPRTHFQHRQFHIENVTFKPHDIYIEKDAKCLRPYAKNRTIPHFSISFSRKSRKNVHSRTYGPP